MKKLLYPFAFILTAFLILYSCSTEEEDTTPPPSVVKPTTPEPEPEPEVTQYTLTVTAGEGGTVSTEGGTYDEGTEVTITATPAEGYEFIGWEGSDSIETSLTLNIVANSTIQALFKKSEIFFESKAPVYSSINQTVDKIIENSYYPGEVMSTQEMFDKFDLKDGCNEFGNCSTNYQLGGVHMLYFDFNNDNKLDLFGFLHNNSNGWITGKGKFIVVENVLNEDYKVNYYDSENYFAVRLFLNDFNGDGRLDILVSNEDRHDDGNGNWYKPEMTPLQILYFNDDGTFQIEEIGNPTSTHDLATGDIDNDGDIDIINFEWVYDKQVGGEWELNYTSVPVFHINKGNGEYETNITNFAQGKLIKDKNGVGYVATNVELFDINNDGCLDLIHGWTNEGYRGMPFGEQEYAFIEVEGERKYFQRDFTILYGNCTGNYDLAKSDAYFFQSPNGINSKAGYFGCSFLDVDNDGDFDIISKEQYPVSYPNLAGQGLRVIINNGDNFYINDDIITPYVLLKSVSNGQSPTDFPDFGQTKLYDADDDGDYDIFPFGINGMEVNNAAVNGKVYWENQGGKFILKGF